MSCNCCNCSLINGFYKCDINDYRIVDENDNLVDIICIRGPLNKKEDIESFKKYKKQNKLIIGCSSYLSFPNKYFF